MIPLVRSNKVKLKRKQLKVLIESFLSETSEDKGSKAKAPPVLNTIEITQDHVKVELKKEGEKIKVYVNGNEAAGISAEKISAIISKAYKEVAQKIADAELDPEDANNILNWADALMAGKRAALQNADKNRLSVLWNSWMEELSKKF